MKWGVIDWLALNDSTQKNHTIENGIKVYLWKISKSFSYHDIIQNYSLHQKTF